jgi:N-acetylglutamate synthase-like GNAT family acetyltransferase
MKIRKANKKDFGEIVGIIKKEYGKEPYNEKWTSRNALLTLSYYSRVGKVYVAELEGVVVGMIITTEGYYNRGKILVIEELIVDSKYQGKGIGNALFMYIEDYSKKGKVTSIILYASIKSRAFDFYKRRGFSHINHMAYMEKELR